MNFALSDEQGQLRTIARQFLNGVPSARQRLERAHGPVFDSRTWERMVDEHGWPAMALPEDAGGWGFGAVELAVVFEELGRTLCPSPMLATVGLASEALRCAAGMPWLSEIAEGTTATVALDGGDGPRGFGPGVQAEDTHPDAPVEICRDGADLVLRGTAHRVLDGGSATLIVVEAGGSAAVVDTRRDVVQERVVITPRPALDSTRPLATLHFDDLRLPADQALDGFDADTWRDRARVSLAAEQVGVAQACLDMTVGYAKVRRQFGRPIGAFQAVQHACADMLVAVESARSATWYAAWALAEDTPDATEASLVAGAMAAEAAFQCAGATIQLHGGIGFTAEHDAHLYFRRARASRDLLGPPTALRARVADQLLGAL